MYYLDLFAGIGGFALGAYWAGWRFDEHYFSEIDEYCIKIYRMRFPESIPLGDITRLSGVDLPKGEWIICGGFPCQDISIAGKGEGISGARSGLWFEMWRIIGILRPRFAIIENVGAITHRGLDTVLGNLAEIGYDAEWKNIFAYDTGAPHQRERIFIIAYPNEIRWDDGRYNNSKYDFSRNEKWDIAKNIKSGRGWERWLNEVCKAENGEVSKSDFFGVDDGISEDMDRIKAIGDSIVPQIAELLFRRIKEIVDDESNII